MIYTDMMTSAKIIEYLYESDKLVRFQSNSAIFSVDVSINSKYVSISNLLGMPQNIEVFSFMTQLHSHRLFALHIIAMRTSRAKAAS